MEQALQYCLLQAHKETEGKYYQIEVSLNQQFEKGKSEIWKCHKNVVEASKNTNSPNPMRDTTNSNENRQAKATKSTTVNVEITSGLHAGKTYKLMPKARKPCWVGRSQGKKFRDLGISLSKDGEVSTCHGKFELVKGQLCFTDTGSTNGTKLGTSLGEELTPQKPYPLEDGLQLVLGGSTFKILLS